MEMQTFQSLKLSEFKKLAKLPDSILIDIRTAPEIFQFKPFKEALEIDMYKPDFEGKLSQLDKSKTYLIYCRSGSRTSYALQLMKDLGFQKVYDLEDGIYSFN